jgi:hypothetical protein
MPKGKTKPKQDQGEQKDKVRYLPVLRLPSQWRVGDRIVTSTNNSGHVSTSTKITTLETGQGCKNLHVNRSACYDRSVSWAIAVPEEQALQEMTGLVGEDSV